MPSQSFVLSAAETELCSILAAPWQGWSSRRDVLTIAADGRTLEISVDVQDIAPKFECARVTVRAASPASLTAAPAPFMGAQNRVSLLLSEEWVENPELPVVGTLGRAPLAQESGPVGSAPASALASCLVADGLLVEAASGERIVVRCGWPPWSLDVLREAGEIENLLAERTLQPLNSGQ